MTAYIAKTVDSKKYWCWYERTVSCPNIPDTEKFQTSIYAKLRTRDPVRPDSRPKPDDLIHAMTSRGPLYRKKEQYGQESRYTNGTIGCGGSPPSSGTWNLREEILWQPHQNIVGTLLTHEVAPSNLTAMRLKIKSQSHNMAENIGEFRESVDLVHASGTGVVSTAKTVYQRLPRAFRRRVDLLGTPLGALFGGIRGRKRLLGDPKWSDIPSAYLGTSFALVPTLGGVHEAMVALGRNTNAPIRRRFVISSRGSESGSYPGQFGGAAEWEISQTRRTIAYVTYNADRLTDWTAGNPAEALWAATPFSWVVDYFLRVGDWLSSLDACVGLSDCVYSDTVRTHAFQMDTAIRNGPTWSLVRPGITEVDQYVRTTGGQLPLPTLPEWRPSGSFKKLSYLAAILVGLRSR